MSAKEFKLKLLCNLIGLITCVVVGVTILFNVAAIENIVDNETDWLFLIVVTANIVTIWLPLCALYFMDNLLKL